MSEQGLRRAVVAMERAGVNQAAIAVFRYGYEQLEQGVTGLIREAEIAPLDGVDRIDDVDVDEARRHDALSRTVSIKLNGGLGTSMGLERAKSLLQVRAGRSFLDIIAQQVLATRASSRVRLPLLFMDSFRTDSDTMAALAAYPELPVDGLPLSFLQNQEPKLRADDLEPVSWPADPSLEWCPPGHGDVFTALGGSGILDELIAAGFRFGFVSNGDNLGATPDGRLAGWFAESGAPFAAEVCRRTENDRKGGHFARRVSDGQLILRESAMVDPAEMDAFTDLHRHPYFNTNNLWLDLEAVRDVLRERDGVLGLPLIRNAKIVDPADPESTPVIQIETAMGAAVGVFEGSTAIEVPRSRFLPVKTTNELLLLRSDVYALSEGAEFEAQAPEVPTVRLDPQFYKTIGEFEDRIPDPPSLRRCASLDVAGDWSFEPGVVCVGRVSLEDAGAPQRVRPGEIGDGA